MIKKNENLIQSQKRCFSILSSKIESIEAKFDELKIFGEQIQEKLVCRSVNLKIR